MFQRTTRLFANPFDQARPVGRALWAALLLAAAAWALPQKSTAAGGFAAAPLSPTTLPGSDTITATICGESVYIFNDQSLNTSGFYSDTLQASDGSDSLLVLKLTVLPLNVTPVSAEICAGGSYDFYGENLTAAGSYDHHFTAENGCDSIILLALSVLPGSEASLSIALCEGGQYVFQNDTLTTGGSYTAHLMAANGCDSAVVLHLSFVPFFVTDLFQTICKGDTAFFAGDTLTASGSYPDSLVATGGCDSTVVLHLTVLDLHAPVREVAICSGSSYFFNGEDLTLPGTYFDTLTATASGCDSLLTLVLDTVPFFTTNLSATLCEGGSFDFDGQLLAQSGLYMDTLTATGGCDSIVVLNLLVLPNSATALSETICANGTFFFNGQSLNQTGTYEMTLPAANGCDSTVTLSLEVLPALGSALEATICAGEAFPYNGTDYTFAGTYSVTLTAQNGCDSTVALTLTVLPNKTYSEQATICSGETFTFNGSEFTQTGTYTADLTAANGCDSTATLVLTVLPEMPVSADATICEGSFFEFHGQNLTAAGTYTAPITGANGCPTTETLHLTVLPKTSSEIFGTICANQVYIFNNQPLNTAGNYTMTTFNSNGCDSTVVLHLTVVPTAGSSSSATICAGETYSFNGQALNQTGSYSATLTAENGCDSLAALHLTVLPAPTTGLTAAICPGDSYQFGNQSLTAAGTYQRTLTAANGCDSTVTLALSVLPTAHVVLAAQICTGTTFSFEGQNLTETGTYSATLTGANGCDSTRTLHLLVANPLASGYSVTICAGESYDFNGTALTQPGNYPATFTATGGCDSIVTLALSVLPVFSSEASESICEGSTFSFDGQDLGAAGDYTGHFTATNGCDSTVVLHLSVLPKSVSTTAATICDGESYDFNGASYAAPGVYSAALTGANGCDSTATLLLAVLPNISVSYSAAICSGGSFPFEGQMLTASGNYSATYPAANGCDSTIELELTIHPAYQPVVEATICAGETYDFFGLELEAAGTYAANFLTANGCDSTVTLHLSVAQPFVGEINTSICEGQSYDFFGQNLTAAGSYQTVFTASNGCDSIINLHLAVHPLGHSEQIAAICAGGSFDFNGQNLTAGGTYQAVLSGQNGCDSTVVLNLTVHPAASSGIEATICAGETYLFNQQQLALPGTYTATLANASSLGCDSTVTLQLEVLLPIVTNDLVTLCTGETVIINGQPVSTSGIYTETYEAANGCDSIVNIVVVVDPTSVTVALQGSSLVATATPGATLQWANCDTQQPIFGQNGTTFTPTATGNYACVAISLTGCFVVSNCVFVQVISTGEPQQNGVDWKIYPNPSSGLFKVELEGVAQSADWKLEVFDARGRLVEGRRFDGGIPAQLDLSGRPAGIYSIRLTDGRSSWAKQLTILE